MTSKLSSAFRFVDYALFPVYVTLLFDNFSIMKMTEQEFLMTYQPKYQ